MSKGSKYTQLYIYIYIYIYIYAHTYHRELFVVDPTNPKGALDVALQYANNCLIFLLSLVV